jgi:hypothetical protein
MKDTTQIPSSTSFNPNLWHAITVEMLIKANCAMSYAHGVKSATCLNRSGRSTWVAALISVTTISTTPTSFRISRSAL